MRATARLVERKRPVHGSCPVAQQRWDRKRPPARQHALQYPNVRPKEWCLMPGALRLQPRPVPRGPQHREVPAEADDREGCTRVRPRAHGLQGPCTAHASHVCCVCRYSAPSVFARTCMPRACHAACSLPRQRRSDPRPSTINVCQAPARVDTTQSSSTPVASVASPSSSGCLMGTPTPEPRVRCPGHPEAKEKLLAHPSGLTCTYRVLTQPQRPIWLQPFLPRLHALSHRPSCALCPQREAPAVSRAQAGCGQNQAQGP